MQKLEKLRTLGLLVAFSLFILSTGAQALEKTNRLGVGMTNQLKNDFPALSFKLQKNKSFAYGGVLGLSTSDTNGGYGAGVKMYRNIFDEPQLNFYLSGMAALLSNKIDGLSYSGFQFDLSLGSEFHFVGLNSLGFSFEFGVSANKKKILSSKLLEAISSLQEFIFTYEKFLIFSLLAALTVMPHQMHAQEAANDIFSADDDDLNVGGDIFNDFNEDIEDAKLVEDERFYRFGRFFSFNLSLGLTSFDGNRGLAYENLPPTYGVSFTFFKDFQSALGLGFEFSKHSMFLRDATRAFEGTSTLPPGYVDVSQLRIFFSYRYYIDTSNLGTAITYSNPYFIARMEYWYTTNEYKDLSEVPKDSGGGLGTALGFGLEFPIEIKESYIGLEFLFHSVAFYDKNTQNYAPQKPGGYGFSDLGGNVYSTMVSYIFNW